MQSQNYFSRKWLEDKTSTSTGYVHCCDFEGQYQVRLADCYRTYFLNGSSRASKTFRNQLDSMITVLRRKSLKRQIRSGYNKDYILLQNTKYNNELNLEIYTCSGLTKYNKTLIHLHQLEDQSGESFFRKLDKVANELEKFKEHIILSTKKQI